MLYDSRPWGEYTILYQSSDCQIKRLTILPGEQTSLQSHKKRNEHWVVLSGPVRVTTNGIDWKTLYVNDYIYVPIGEKHRIWNDNLRTHVHIIEVQTGESFEEEDIIRYEDSYGRVQSTRGV